MDLKRFFLGMLLTIALLCCSCGKNDDNKQAGATETPIEKDNEIVLEGTEWAEQTTFYQIFVRSFCDSDGDGIGDFNGIAQKVDYLKELGVGAIWLMPMMESDSYHGYDVLDYYSAEQDYGTMEDFTNMLKVLHDNDIRVIIDFVVNHTSIDHEWFAKGAADEQSEYRDYYFIYSKGKKPANIDVRSSAEYQVYFQGFYSSTMPDLNYDNQNVRKEIKDIAKFWLDKGVDGFRLDGSCHIYDAEKESEKTVEWWQEFSEYVLGINDEAFIVGENWLVTSKEISEYYAAMSSSFEFPLCYNIEDAAGGNNKDVLKDALKAYELYEEKAASEGSAVELPIMSTMIGNHDMDRLASRLKGDTDKLKLAASLQLTLPGTPFIYYGDELGQQGIGSDAFKREAFDWYKSAVGQGMATSESFTTPKFTIANDGISYEEQINDDTSLLNHYKKLIEIRNENTIMYNGEYETLGLNNNGLYAYKISGAEDGSSILVVHNLRDDEQKFTLNVGGIDLCRECEMIPGTVVLEGKGTYILRYTSSEAPIVAEEFEYSRENENKVTIVLNVPEDTPMDEDIYIVGDFNNWNPCDEDYIMERTTQTTCTIVMYQSPGTSMEYKFTRGSWEMREQSASGTDAIGEEKKQNRSYTYEEKDKELTLTVEKWFDM